VTKTVHLDEIPYCRDSCELFERVRDLPGAALLDSSFPHAQSGRYDIITAAPWCTECALLPTDSSEPEARRFFEELGAFHAQHYADTGAASQDIPFSGGLLGYIGYDCGNRLHRVNSPGRDTMRPALIMAAYDWGLVQDHLLRRAVAVFHPRLPKGQRRDLLARLRRPVTTTGPEFRLRDTFRSNFGEEAYREAFERIQAYIQAGDCYQVNLAQRFSAPYQGDPWRAYRALRPVAAAPFAAYLDLGEGDALLSLSPERFLSLHGHHVETSPIKGTRPRYSDRRADELAAQDLRASDKDRAENLMIVDLLRNDLGRSCVPGSIHVDRLFEVQSYPTVHHLVSTVSGELREGCGPGELLRDSFPGGSITGAPKRRAMEIISELEPHPRRAYCGSVLYISADGRMDSNIAIRSVLCEGGEVYCWGGGGIVADSQWQSEYQETWDKVGKFLAVLEGL
jgi:para-aminobenzoate synthetase component 1